MRPYPFPTTPSPHHAAPDPAQVLRLPEVLRLTGLSRATLYRLRAVGDFPPPIQLSPQAIGWHRADVVRWIAERPARPVRRA